MSQRQKQSKWEATFGVELGPWRRNEVSGCHTIYLKLNFLPLEWISNFFILSLLFHDDNSKNSWGI